MSDFARAKVSVIPCLLYRDAPAAIDWLGRAFGFERHAVYANDDGTIAHAELRFGNGMVMLGSTNDSEFGRLNKQPEEIGGAVTQSIYVIVRDADMLHDMARAAGAEIMIPLRDESYGGRGFTCRDLEGHLWSFGTYDPWTAVE